MEDLGPLPAQQQRRRAEARSASTRHPVAVDEVLAKLRHEIGRVQDVHDVRATELRNHLLAENSRTREELSRVAQDQERGFDSAHTVPKAPTAVQFDPRSTFQGISSSYFSRDLDYSLVAALVRHHVAMSARDQHQKDRWSRIDGQVFSGTLVLSGAA